AAPAGAVALLKSRGCVACHGIDSRIVGPAFRDVAAKQAGRADAVPYLVGRIRAGGSGTWGSVAMPPQDLSDADADTIARWIAAGADH
ncbi:MAG TPA: c-type cytochrome, partial [Burkholderiaceae bacterium]